MDHQQLHCTLPMIHRPLTYKVWLPFYRKCSTFENSVVQRETNTFFILRGNGDNELWYGHKMCYIWTRVYRCLQASTVMWNIIRSMTNTPHLTGTNQHTHTIAIINLLKQLLYKQLKTFPCNTKASGIKLHSPWFNCDYNMVLLCLKDHSKA